ncbi:MAG: xylulokinase, partial [Chloroflexi bacterium]|nr:xylulokinase [Chloroflexota bacterium]
IGTSGVVFAPLAQYAYEPEGKLHAFCHAMPGQYHFMGVMLSAAGSLQWYRDTLAPDDKFSSLIDAARSIESEGLFYLPYLTGERTPHADPLARGGFIGLTARHTRAHMTRAVLEGVAFGLRDSFELIKKATDIHEVRVSGGGARSDLWLQIIASIINYPVVPTETIEGAAYGAALLAGLGSGLWNETQHLVNTAPAIEPDESVAHYDAQYAIYRQLYPALVGVFHAISVED